jgi:hypothetical protein
VKKSIFAVLFLFASVTGVFCQTKEQDIMKLLEVSGTREIGIQTFAMIIEYFKTTFTTVPDVYWDKIYEKSDLNEFITMMVPLYDKYYTHEDIKGLIAFYESPLGQKMVQVSPEMNAESMALGQAWGTKLAEEIIADMQAEGYF